MNNVKENINGKIIKKIKNCEIKINNKIIPFSYFYKFSKKGKYIIQYSFKILLSKINCVFRNCSSLTNIDLSNFIAKNVTNMSDIFACCSSLKNINLSNFILKI